MVRVADWLVCVWAQECLPKLARERRETAGMWYVYWYVYFLRLNNGDIYVGRVRSHERGHVDSAKAHRPVSLRSYVAVLTERNARELERYFKSGSGKAFANKRLWQDK